MMQVYRMILCMRKSYRGALANIRMTFLLAILYPATASGQVSGVVLDHSNRSPLPGATLFINDTVSAISDTDGRFTVQEVEFPAILRVTYIGYESLSLPLNQGIKDITLELKASNYLLGEVVVSAYEGRQRIIESPGSIALIPQKEIKIDNDIYFVPSLNRVPGIYAHSGSYNTNRITIRGIGSRSLFITSKIRAYYDNIPLTTGDGETTVEDIDPNLIDRIETIKGPSSSLYGAGLGGTLLIRSISPSSQERSLTYSITGGSFGYLKNDISFAYGNEKNRLGLVVNKIRSDGYRENNKYDRFTTGINYTSYLSAKSRLNFLSTYIDLNAQIPSSLNQEMYENDPRAAAPNWAAAEGYEDNRKIITGLGFNHLFDNHSSIDASVFHSWRDLYERRPFNILTDNVNALGSRVKYEYKNEWNGYGFSLVAGGEYFLDFYNWQTYENDNKAQGDMLSDNKESRENINVFLKTDLTFPFKTFITLGINMNSTNYDYESLFAADGSDNSGDYSFGLTFSPRLAVSHPITSSVFLYGNISHGFSPPSLVETLTPSGTINPDIQPEKGINYEAGSKGMLLSNKLFYDIALFSMHINDLIVAQRVGEDEFIGVNAGKTVNNGLEFSLNYNFLPVSVKQAEFTGFITYTLAHYTFKDFVEAGNDYSGNPLTGVPKHVFNAGLYYRIQAGLYGNLNYQFVDKMPMRDDNSIYSDAYQLVNLKLGYSKEISRHFSFDVYGIVNNIFDEKYASMISVNAASFGGNPPRYYYPGLPRNYFLNAALHYTF